MAVAKHVSAILDIDRLVHEPARLVLLSILYAVESADFNYLSGETDLTKGNLSSHLSRLEDAAYIHVEKTYKGKTPLTIYRITADGGHALETYLSRMGNFLQTIHK
mgnify:FL=1